MNTSSKDAIIFCAGAALGAGAIYYITERVKRINTNPYASINFTANGIDNPAEVQLQALPFSAATPPAAIEGATTNNDKMINFEKDDVLVEQLTRNVQFFGLEGQKKIANAFVVVVGLGGVGSHCAHLLLRSGVGHLRLVDFDQLTLSSLNRHCLATRADVGIPKATCLHRHFMEISPETYVEAMCEMYTDDTEDSILSGRPDYVIDAIDNIDTKVSLLAACKRRNIPVLCVAGAGAKADPTRLRFADISASAVDPLARSVRYRLRKDYGISSGIQVLLSNEKPRCGLVSGVEDPADLGDYQVIPNFRIRTIPVLGTTPAIFGLAAAGHVLCELAKSPLHPTPMYRIQNKAIQTQYDRLEQREIEFFGITSTDQLGVDLQEVEILIKEVWQGSSARAPVPPADDQSVTRGLGNLVLTRWDRTRNGCVDNLVLLTKDEADEHDGCDFEQLKMNEPQFVEKVEKKLARARRDFLYSYY